MSETITEGTLLWEPSEKTRRQCNLAGYMRWLKEHHDLEFAGYDDLWRWSTTSLEEFWNSVWNYFDLKATVPPATILGKRQMPGAEWFPGTRLNYTAQVFANATAKYPALLFQDESGNNVEISWAELETRVAAVAAGLEQLGVGCGDRVVGFLPNRPETVIVFLAVASLGATWSCCSPDFGTRSVIDRFKQIEPKVLFSVTGYDYGGKRFNRSSAASEIIAALSTLEHAVIIEGAPGEKLEVAAAGPQLHAWSDFTTSITSGPPDCRSVPFDHPLWILYSSGTTGLPKPIVQGHGGIIIEMVKSLGLHMDLKPGDRFFWFTTTGWMVWNFLQAGLLLGVTPVLFDGNPGYPGLDRLWHLAGELKVNFFGTSAPFIMACRKAGLEPGKKFDFRPLRGVGSTGSPLPPEGFKWVYDKVKSDVLLASACGGTDVCTAFLNGAPLVPVWAGEASCRCLGDKVEAFDEAGNSVVGEVGEMVITEPMPSMPVFFWNDADGRRYRESYFDMFPGVWRHGDWIRITERGSAVILGRSDATLKRMGVRMGSSDFYTAIEALPEIESCLIVGFDRPGGGYFMPLFVVPAAGLQLDETLREKIKNQIRTVLSPRHLPDKIYQVADLPRTLTGKKMEVPVKKILMGMPPAKAVNPGAMANPEALDFFLELAKQLNP